MKRTKRCQTRLRHHPLYHVGIVVYLICAQWMSIDSTFADAIAAGAALQDRVTSPSRNEATNPLKEPTPSTLQGAFLSSGGKLTDANNGSASTSPAEASASLFTTVTAAEPSTTVTAAVPSTIVAAAASFTTPAAMKKSTTVVAAEKSTIVATTEKSTTVAAAAKSTTVAAATATAKSTTVAAAAAETALNARTAAVATMPVDNARVSVNGGPATAVDPEPATTTDRPPVSAEDAVRTGAEPSPRPQSLTPGPAMGGDYGADPPDKNLMANMLKSWFDRTDDAADKSEPAPHKAATAGNPATGNKSLFERWDEASEEQERVLEDAMRSERPYADDVIDGGSASPPPSSSVLAADQNTPSRWFVLLLSGNSTVAQMRRTDFAKYLKLNLAARLSLEYDQVKINRVLVVPPRLMVNVSVVPVSERASAAAAAVAAAAAATAATAASSARPSSHLPADRVTGDDDPLHNLVETNATLMELSGEEYRVEKFMSLKSQKPQSMEEAAAVVSNRHADIDYFIYATVGPLCLAAVLGFLLLTLYKYVRRHPVQWPWKRKFGHPSFWPGGGDHRLHRHRRMTDECVGGGGSVAGGPSADETARRDGGGGGGGGGSVNVIYSGEFEQSQQQQLSGSWLDDASFVPDDSLDRIRTPTLLRTAATAAKSKTFTDMLQQRGDGPTAAASATAAAAVLAAGCNVTDGGRAQLRRYHAMHHGPSSRADGQCAAAAASAAAAVAVHAQSPRLSRENKLRILGCKQSCLLLPAVQPAAEAALATAPLTPVPPPQCRPADAAAAPEDDSCGRP